MNTCSWNNPHGLTSLNSIGILCQPDIHALFFCLRRRCQKTAIGYTSVSELCLRKSGPSRDPVFGLKMSPVKDVKYSFERCAGITFSCSFNPTLNIHSLLTRLCTIKCHSSKQVRPLFNMWIEIGVSAKGLSLHMISVWSAHSLSTTSEESQLLFSPHEKKQFAAFHSFYCMKNNFQRHENRLSWIIHRRKALNQFC